MSEKQNRIWPLLFVFFNPRRFRYDYGPCFCSPPITCSSSDLNPNPPPPILPYPPWVRWPRWGWGTTHRFRPPLATIVNRHHHHHPPRAVPHKHHMTLFFSSCLLYLLFSLSRGVDHNPSIRSRASKEKWRGGKYHAPFSFFLSLSLSLTHAKQIVVLRWMPLSQPHSLDRSAHSKVCGEVYPLFYFLFFLLLLLLLLCLPYCSLNFSSLLFHRNPRTSFQCIAVQFQFNPYVFPSLPFPFPLSLVGPCG